MKRPLPPAGRTPLTAQNPSHHDAETDDVFVEANEDFKVVLTNAGSSSGDVTLGSSDQVTTTITSADASEWSIAGSDTVAEGDSASYTVSLSGTLQAGETATIDLGITNIDTTSADYASFADAVNAAILGRPELGFDGTTLTFTSDGSAMTDVVISLAATDDVFLPAGRGYSGFFAARVASIAVYLELTFGQRLPKGKEWLFGW